MDVFEIYNSVKKGWYNFSFQDTAQAAEKVLERGAKAEERGEEATGQLFLLTVSKLHNIDICYIIPVSAFSALLHRLLQDDLDSLSKLIYTRNAGKSWLILPRNGILILMVLSKEVGENLYVRL